MQNFTKFSLTLLASLILTACGSSGGGGNNDAATESSTAQPAETIINETPTTEAQTTETTVTETSVIEPSTPTSPAVDTPAIETPTVDNSDIKPLTDAEEWNIFAKNYPTSKYTISISSTGKVDSTIYWNDQTTDSYNYINITDGNGEKINVALVPEGMDSVSNIRITSSNMTRYLDQGTNVIAGLVQENDSALYTVAVGKNPTQNMPVSGTASYTGKGMHGYMLEENLNFESSQVNLVADFDQKTIRGEVNSPDNLFETQKIAANIKNNAFEGTLDNIELRGGFFGNNASEMTGVYNSTEISSENKNMVIGSFIGKKE